MIRNYKTEISPTRREGSILVKKGEHYNTWRVYFQTTELEELRTEETVTKIKPIYGQVQIEIPVFDDSGFPTGEFTTDVIEEKIGEEEVEEVEVNEVWESKYFEVILDKQTSTTDTIELIRARVLQEITEYDTGDEVNSFLLNGNTVWLDKETRVGLMNSTNIQKAAGITQSILWFNGIQVKVPCDLAIQLLSALELYALECYNKTAEHYKNASELETGEELVNYDYTQGYPEKLEINV